MTYPGNSSLPTDVQERVLNTYRQTLDLAAQGNRQEASLGCDFILRLDQEFDPARRLMDRLEQGEGPVEVEDLRPGGSAFADAAGDQDAPFGGLDDMDLSVPDLDLEKGEAAAGGSPLAGEMKSLIEERRFDELLQKAQERREAVSSDPELQRLVQTASSRKEAEPYIESFLESARKAVRSGDRDEARRSLESARELDPTHPALSDLEQVLGASGAARQEAPAPGGLGEGGMELGDLLELEVPPEPSGEEAQTGAPAEEGGGPDEDPFADLDDSLGGLSLEEEGAEEGDERVRALLQEGQEAFDQGDLQGAIDAWSRIFLIDIDHQEASRRIEEARRLKAERERQLEEVFHEGVESFEAGDRDTARARLEQVLESQPNHLAAQEYLEKLESGEVPEPSGARAETAAGAGAPEPEAPAEPPPARKGAFADQEELPPLEHEPLVPPDPSELEEPSEKTERSEASGLRRNFLLIGGAVLVVVLALGWLVVQNWSSFFPNATELEQGAAGAPDPIAAATTLHRLGRTPQAVARLRKIPPADPHYEEAQALISQWEAEADQGTSGAEGEGGLAGDGEAPEDEDVAPAGQRQQELLDRARAAADEGENLLAEELYLEAREISELPPEEQDRFERVRESLTDMRTQIELIRGGDWEYALPELWRAREADPSNRDVHRLLVTAYYNLAVRDLQRGDATGAVAQLEEAQSLTEGSDPEVERLMRFARAYQGRNKDFLYQIYVKYLPFR